MSVTVANTSDSCTIAVHGEFSLPQIGDIRQGFLECVDTHDTICLNLEDVSAADVSCLQLFCSIHKSLSRRNKSITISGAIPSLFSALFARAGYYRHSACPGRLVGPCVLQEVAHE